MICRVHTNLIPTHNYYESTAILVPVVDYSSVYGIAASFNAHWLQHGPPKLCWYPLLPGEFGSIFSGSSTLNITWRGVRATPSTHAFAQGCCPLQDVIARQAISGTKHGTEYGRVVSPFRNSDGQLSIALD